MRVQTVGTLCAGQPRHTVRDVCSLRRLVKAIARCTAVKTPLTYWWRLILSYSRLIQKTGKEEERGPLVHRKRINQLQGAQHVDDMQSWTFWRNKHAESNQFLLLSGDDHTWKESSGFWQKWIYHHSCLTTWLQQRFTLVTLQNVREERGRRRERTGGSGECWTHWGLTWHVLLLANVSSRLVYSKVNWLLFWQINTVWVTMITTMVETFECRIPSCYIFSTESYRDGTWGTSFPGLKAACLKLEVSTQLA